MSITENEAQKSQPATTKPLRPRKYNFGKRKAVMKLSPSAVSHLRALLEQPEPKLIRIGTKAKGCSGLAYHLEYVDKPSPLDEQVEQDGVKVLIDNKALLNIIGSEMDWLEDKLNERFVFKNPNISEQALVHRLNRLLTTDQLSSAGAESLSAWGRHCFKPLYHFHSSTHRHFTAFKALYTGIPDVEWVYIIASNACIQSFRVQSLRPVHDPGALRQSS